MKEKTTLADDIAKAEKLKVLAEKEIALREKELILMAEGAKTLPLYAYVVEMAEREMRDMKSKHDLASMLVKAMKSVNGKL